MLALAAAWQAFVQDAPHLYVTALVALGLALAVAPQAGKLPEKGIETLERGIVIAALTPLVILFVWLAMRRVRARLHDAAGSHAGHGDL